MKNFFKKNGILILTFILGLAVFGAKVYEVTFKGRDPEYVKTHSMAIPEALPDDMELRKEQVEEDRNEMIKYLEDIHPYFVLENDKHIYEEAKEKYINSTNVNMKVKDFRLVTTEYLSSLQDAHTTIWMQDQEYVTMNARLIDGKAYLCEDGEVKDIWIEKIGGVEIEKIYEIIGKIFPAENEIAKKCNILQHIGERSVLESSGVKIENNMVDVLFSDGSIRQYVFENINKIENSSNSESFKNSWYKDGGIFVINFNECRVDDELESIVGKLRKEIYDGCNKVIIDVRNNSGGDSVACDKLLEAMDMKAPGYAEEVVRYSLEAKKERGYLKSSGIHRFIGNIESKQNPNVNLIVLSSEWTFSSAQMLCVDVRDGNLGKIIGQPSGNMPNHYGDIIRFTLKNSHLNGSIPHKQFFRPNKDNNERMLVPDIVTPSDEAYEVAVKYLNEIKK